MDTLLMAEQEEKVLEQGYRNCRDACNKYFSNLRWIIGNLSNAQRRDLEPLLNHVITVTDLLDLKSEDGLPLDVWNELRDEFNDAFAGKAPTAELAALVETVRRYQVPRQLIYDPLMGADLWIRQNRFQTFAELDSFASRTGGSLLASTIPVLGCINPGFESCAIEAGKGVMLTQILANFANDAKQNRVFLAEDDLKECEVEVQRIKLRKSIPTLKHLVRLYCWRIEKMLLAGGQVLSHLDYDGRRSMTSLLSWTWKTMNQMRLNPDLVLQESVLTRHDMFRLKAKHLLGLEGSLPIDLDHSSHSGGH